MKNLLLILALFVGNSFAEFKGFEGWILKGEMTFNCLVQDQVILKINEGKAERFSHYIDGLKNGDEHTIKLTWWDVRNDVQFKDANKVAVSFWSDNKIPLIDKYKEYNRVTDFVNSKRLRPFSDRSVRGEDIKIDVQLHHDLDDYILYLSGTEIADNGGISFQRYYRNDWDLHLNSNTHILVSNCLGVKGDVSQLINDSISIGKE